MLTATSCKHMCCREGVDKAPKAPKGSSGPRDGSKVSQISSAKSAQSLSNNVSAKRAAKHLGASEVEVVDLTSGKYKKGHSGTSSGSFKSLQNMHAKIVDKSPLLLSSTKKPAASSARLQQKPLSFLSHIDTGSSSIHTISSDYDADWIEDLPSPSVLLNRAEPGLSGDSDLNDITTWPEDDVTGMDTEAGSPEDSPPPTAEEQTMAEDPFDLPPDDRFVDSGLEAGREDLEQTVQPSPNHPDAATQPATDKISAPSAARRELTVPPICSRTVLHGPYTTSGQNQGESSRKNSHSPPRKRQRVYDTDPTKADVVPAPPTQPPGRVDPCKLRPWEDMTGIDMEFLESIADIVEFV